MRTVFDQVGQPRSAMPDKSEDVTGGQPGVHGTPMLCRSLATRSPCWWTPPRELPQHQFGLGVEGREDGHVAPMMSIDTAADPARWSVRRPRWELVAVVAEQLFAPSTSTRPKGGGRRPLQPKDGFATDWSRSPAGQPPPTDPPQSAGVPVSAARSGPHETPRNEASLARSRP